MEFLVTDRYDKTMHIFVEAECVEEVISNMTGADKVLISSPKYFTNLETNEKWEMYKKELVLLDNL